MDDIISDMVHFTNILVICRISCVGFDNHISNLN